MQPERKIEKLLRAFAKKRRADAGDSFKLHPATRRLLQGEVARSKPRAAKDSLMWQLFGGMSPGASPGMIYCVLLTFFILMAAMFLPTLNKAKSRAQAVRSLNNLRQIGMAVRMVAESNDMRLPESLAEITGVIGTNTLTDPTSGQPFVYVAGGNKVDRMRSNSVLAYSQEAAKNRAVLFADGHVETVSRTRFFEITNRGLIQLALAGAPARRELAGAPAPVVATATLSGGGGAGGASRIADLPAATAALSAGDFEKNKTEADDAARKKVAAETQAGGDAVVLFDRDASGALAAKTLALQPPGAVAGTLSTAPKAEAPAATGLRLDGPATQTDAFSDKLAVQEALISNTATVTQNFAQQSGKNASAQNLFKNAAASAKLTPVLANFQFQQNGSAVVVVDEDGSVYNGYLVAADETKLRNETADLKREPAKAALPAQKQAKDSQMDKNPESSAQNYFFRVTGTNRSLRQNVVFTGNVLALSNVAQASSQTFNGSFNRAGSGGGNISQVTDKNLYQQSLFSNSRIAGTAVVNSTNEIEINALPVTP